MKIYDHVPPQWPNDVPCSIAFVGEAPGDDETVSGIPLTGASGQVFNRLLRLANIDRNECMITNVFDEQLPDNDVTNWCEGAKVRKGWDGYDLPPVQRGKYLRPEYEWHLDRLAEELNKVNPVLIVPLGGTALWALTGRSGITARRGAVDESCMTVPGRKILPVNHPAFIIHSNYKPFKIAAMDMLKVKAEAESSDIVYTDREFILEPSLTDIREFALRAEAAKLISIDIETIPKFRHMKSIGFSFDIHTAIVVPFTDTRKPNQSYWPTVEAEFEAWRLVKEICENPVPKLGQNFQYDLRWLWEYGINVRNYRHDTRLLSHSLYPELPKDLGTLGSLYAKERPWKTLRIGAKSIKREE